MPTTRTTPAPSTPHATDSAAESLTHDPTERLTRTAEAISRCVVTWDGTSLVPHRFDAIEFQLDGKEFGHYHRFGVLDIPFPRSIRDILVHEGIAAAHRYVPDSGWVTYRVRTEDDAQHATRLLRLSYLYRSIVRSTDVLKLEQIRTELVRLSISKALQGEYAKALSMRAQSATVPDLPPGFNPTRVRSEK